MKGQLRGASVGDVVAFVDPGLIVGVVRGKLDSCEMVNVVVRVPVAYGKFSGDWDVVLELFEFGPPIVLSVGNANSCRANVEVAVLVVATVRFEDVELELNVHRVGGDKVVVVVSVRQDVELAESLAPLL